MHFLHSIKGKENGIENPPLEWVSHGWKEHHKITHSEYIRMWALIVNYVIGVTLMQFQSVSYGPVLTYSRILLLSKQP